MTGRAEAERDGDWGGKDRRQTAQPVSRDEFVSFQRRLDDRMDIQDGKLAEGTKIMARLNDAMFAKDENNEFESPGVMTVMQKINRHVDMMCNFAMGVRRVGLGVIWAGGVAAAIAAIATAAKAMGML